MSQPPGFQLQFDPSEIHALAESYSYPGGDPPTDAGERASDLGYDTREDFLSVCAWKSPRNQRRWTLNSASLVREVTGIALTTHEERLRIGALTLLSGVGWPTASVLLHVAIPERYPILDFRALWSLGIKSRPYAYTFDFWIAYAEEARRLSRQHGVSLRELDRALWQYSKKHGIGEDLD